MHQQQPFVQAGSRPAHDVLVPHKERESGMETPKAKRPKKTGQERHSLGRNAGNVPTSDIDESERLRLRAAMHKAPGTTEHRGPRTRAKASAPKMPGRSQRAERKAAEKEAAKRAAREPTLDELFAQVEKEANAITREKQQARQRMVDQRAKVWQLGSWMNGDKPCPDELIEWEG